MLNNTKARILMLQLLLAAERTFYFIMLALLLLLPITFIFIQKFFLKSHRHSFIKELSKLQSRIHIRDGWLLRSAKLHCP